ncbi:ATP-binding protein [Streptomyces sp. NRRL B-24484]|uniref:ATP-binding protein n=1 Tax=Streptomyces sp. NRRL B-24484 TaxID=1463833 RepID=UPI0013314001|nr:tetratricopeptide repeat protein [Streptomyces sp. NRRL B-24484]
MLREFGQRLDQLRRDAGNPSGPQLIAADEDGKLTGTAISELQKGRAGVFRVYDWEFVSAFVCACRKHDESTVKVLTAARTDLVEWKNSYTRMVTLAEEFDRASKEKIPGTAPDGPSVPSASPELPPLPPLPGVAAGFTGRGKELDDLLTLLDPLGDPEPECPGTVAAAVVVTAAVRGMGGIGKTTLALAAGHRALVDGAFTGAVFLDLRGYDDTPTDAGRALDDVLRQLGVDTSQIPPEEAQRAALYRAELATRTRAGERVLVIADNVSAASQVEHLVPAGPHRLLVTSRDEFAAVLGARLVDLDVLAPEQAVGLVDAAVRLVLPRDGRIAADPIGTARVAELCGYLPLALQIAAAQLVADRSLKLAALADELHDPAERLDVLDDGSRAVRGVLERSVRRLTAPQEELFRLLAVVPGPDMSLEAVVALSGVGKARDIRMRLAALVRGSLVRQDPDSGRWSMHDLVRAYATEQAQQSPQASAKALTHLLNYYARTVQAADAHLNLSTGGDKNRFPNRGTAMEWLDAERANLVAAVHTAHASGHHEVTMSLAHFLGGYLRSRRYLQDALDVATLARNAATSLGDRHGEGRAWNNLGLALRELRRFDDALNAHQHALDIYRDLGDRRAEGSAWNNLGSVLKGLRRFDDALNAIQHALDIRRDLGDRHLEATAWNNLGLALRGLRRFDEALNAHQHALDIHRDLGDRHLEGGAWNNLGNALAELRRFDDALNTYQHALDIHHDLGDRHLEGMAWNNLGNALAELRRFDDALNAHQHALDIHHDLGDRHLEGRAWNNLGTVLKRLRRFDDALNAHQHALDIRQALGDRHGEGGVWNNLGTALRGAGEVERAVEAGERAVAVFHELDDAYHEGEALGELADTLQAAGRPAGEVRATREASAEAYRRAGAEAEAEEELGKANE